MWFPSLPGNSETIQNPFGPGSNGNGRILQKFGAVCGQQHDLDLWKFWVSDLLRLQSINKKKEKEKKNTARNYMKNIPRKKHSQTVNGYSFDSLISNGYWVFGWMKKSWL